MLAKGDGWVLRGGRERDDDGGDEDGKRGEGEREEE